MNPECLPSLVLHTAEVEGINPWNIMFFWGDYNVVAAVRPDRIEDFHNTAFRSSVAYRVLGRVAAGPPALYGLAGSRKRRLRVLRNENFMRQSFNSDVGGHVDHMLRTQLFPD